MLRISIFIFLFIFTGCTQKVFQDNNTNLVAINASNTFYVETYRNILTICQNEAEESCTYISYKDKKEANDMFYAFLNNISINFISRPIIDSNDTLKYFNPKKIYKVEIFEEQTLKFYIDSKNYKTIKFESKDALTNYYNKLLRKI